MTGVQRITAVALPMGPEGVHDLDFRDGICVAVRRSRHDTARALVIPALVEAHCHLDKCYSAHRMPAIGGDLAAALNLQRQDKVHWTADDLRARGEAGLQDYADAGTHRVRSHVDWNEGPEPPLAWSVLEELATGWRDRLHLQRAALVSPDLLCQPDVAEAIARAIPDSAALGLFIHGHANLQEAIRSAFRLADRFGFALDFHVDEGLDPALNGLEVIADVALDTGFEGPVLCGHSCSLILRDAASFARIADKLARAGVAVVSLPTTNLYLQGRTHGTPDRRGITRIKELVRAGVTVAIGSDNVADAFCPVGQHDPMAALHLAVLAGHLDPPLDQWLPLVTTNPLRALGHTPPELIGTPVQDLRVSRARDVGALIAGRAGPLEQLEGVALELAS